MRTRGSPDWLEAVRRLAVARVLDGYDVAEVADFLGVHPASVYRWLAGHRRGGEAALAAVPHPGRAPRLSERQAARVLSWVRGRCPRDFGYETEHWTAPRVAALVEREFGVRFNHRYLNGWLSRRGVSPQVPDRVARERDEAAIARWVAVDWPRVKRGPRGRGRPSCSPTRAGF